MSTFSSYLIPPAPCLPLKGEGKNEILSLITCATLPNPCAPLKEHRDISYREI